MSLGRLERSNAPKPMGDINMTPLIDVMLVLVVILLVTAPLLTSTVKLDLPKTDAAASSEAPRFLSVAIDKDGKLLLDEKPTTQKALQELFKTKAKAAPDTELQLRADKTVAYGKVVEIIGLAQLAGISRIGFVAEAENQK